MITYSELKKLETYEERLSKLLLRGTTYESPRQIVLDFFKSSPWLTRRKEIIDRDYASDLGVIGQDIYGKIYVHHIDPITEEDVKRGDPKLLDPENLITTSHHTHMTIHYQYYEPYVERRPGDTKLWMVQSNDIKQMVDFLVGGIMNDTIFYRLKEQLGINSEDTSFDYELLMHIKTAFATLTQLGVFDTTPKIDKEITWDAVYIEANPSLHELQDFLEGFVFLEVKLIFDPPTASTLSHLDRMSEELKWRIKEAYTPIIKNPVEETYDE